MCSATTETPAVLPSTRMTKFYLNLLSPDARIIIARFFLEDRNDKKMYCPLALEMMLHDDSPFSNELPMLFPELKISGDGDLCSGTVRICWGLDRSVRTLERIGSNLDEMYGEMKSDFQRWYVPLIAYCGRLKFLCLDVTHDVYFMWQEVVSNASHSLERLKLVGLGIDAEKVKLKANFPNLTSLKLSGSFGIRNGSSMQVIELLLKTLGKTLKSVSVASTLFLGTTDEKHISELLYSHCPNLQDFVGLSGNMSFKSYRALLEHYGPQVQRVRISGFNCNARIYGEILSVCPNLRLPDGYYELCEKPDPTLLVTASRLEQVGLFLRSPLFNEADKVMSFVKQLVLVSNISIISRRRNSSMSQLTLLECIARAELPELKSLELQSYALDSEVLRRLLPIMPKLVKFKFDCVNVVDDKALQKVCAAGMNLCELHWKIEGPRRRSRLYFSVKEILIFKKLISAIRHHPLLQCFTVSGNRYVESSTRDKVKDAVQGLRHRRVLITFGPDTFLYGKCVAGEGRSYVIPT